MARAKRSAPSPAGLPDQKRAKSIVSVTPGVESADKLTFLDREPGHFAVALWKNVFIQAWAAQANAAAMMRVQAIVSGKTGVRLGVRSSISVICADCRFRRTKPGQALPT